MFCPFCRHDETMVKESRLSEDNSAVRRRRLCPNCECRFTTFERVQLRELVVLKRSGRRQPFDRDKLARSIATAVAKRPLDPVVVDQAVARLVRRLEMLGETEVQSAQIGDLVLETLHALDDVAYIRYASVYREFRGANDFASFLTSEALCPTA